MISRWKTTVVTVTACLAIAGCANQTTDDEPVGVSRQALTTKAAAGSTDNGPTTTVPAGPSPSELLKGYKLHAPPSLATAGDVPRFIAWAGTAHTDEQDDGRKLLIGASSNKAVVEGFIKEIEGAQSADPSRALLALGLLGEMKSPAAESYLRDFATRALPREGTVIEGEIIEQTQRAQLQGKAADGLAYLNSDTSNKALMDLIANHPSRIVRAEAINAYLWNHGDGADARKRLSQVVRKDEVIFIDRVRRVTGETADTFNPKLEAFLKQHPEAVPPAPTKLAAKSNPRRPLPAFDGKAPRF